MVGPSLVCTEEADRNKEQEECKIYETPQRVSEQDNENLCRQIQNFAKLTQSDSFPTFYGNTTED